ncbi:hypothetical protein [Actinophytocola xinjiangensis]|uniref:hypothetical protein n=1 Tax=Actinophytocola xinjiangensis TaxID=485602 RepID=UPI000B195F0A|nr:hypothetical protein [Actinophytocola xinjiangensis]
MTHKPANAETRQYQLDKAYQALSTLEGVVTEAEVRERRMDAAPRIDASRFPAAEGR